MGKVLVIIILVLAVVGCAFIATYSATATNWKAAVDDYQKELNASRANTTALNTAYQKVLSERNTVQSRVKDLEDELARLKLTHKQELEDKTDLITKAENAAKASKAVATATEAEAKRLREEVALHRQNITKRDQAIAERNKEIDRLTNRAVQAESHEEILKVRNVSLLEQVKELGQKLAKAETGGGTSGSLVRSSNAKNPPGVYVKGSVTNVLKDSGLIEVNVGSDDGLKDGNTLEVYRLKPKPEYLGTLKIIEAFHHKSVGRMIRPDGGVRRSAVVQNDIVASKIMAR
jgi:hypothetical protein